MSIKVSKYSTQIWIDQFTGKPCDRNDSHAIFFASVLESRVYSMMLSENYQIVRQRKIEIKPKTVTFPAMTWACDFRIWNKNDIELGHLNIEAKGLSFDSFVIKLQMLELHAPDEFKRTILVVQDTSTPVPRALNSMKILGQIATIDRFYFKLRQLGF